MKLSTKTRYAVTAMLELSKYYDEKSSVSISEISKAHGLSISYLEQLLLKLKNNNLVVSLRGKSGGYQLAKPPAIISIKDIMEAVEGPVSIVDCLIHENKCDQTSCCATRPLWTKLNDRFLQLIGEIYLSDL
ncbi:MAG TPA: Rrf2 family transcriptional regulator [Chlamydiales bacterium]|nr:Rrf2 family transcriptional regulator [Chlamydiales bacterium]